MTVLVTGASGLVGSHVVAALRERGERVRALVRPASREVVVGLGAEAVVGDATDAAAWTRAAQGVDAIVHAAAIVGRRASWEAYLAANVEATRLATAAAADARARLVHVSSVAVYRGTAAYHVGAARRTEAEPFGPIPERDFYGRSKRMAEAVVREAAERGTIDAVALRPDVIYGERDRLFTPRVLRTLRRPFVPQIGRGTNHLACVYAGNVAAAALAALAAPAPPAPPARGFRVYHVTSDGAPTLTQREFFAACARALGRRYRPLPIPSPLARVVLRLAVGRRLARAGVAFLSGDNPYSDERIRTEIGWRPPISAPDAIRRTVAWFVTNEKPGR